MGNENDLEKELYKKLKKKEREREFSRSNKKYIDVAIIFLGNLGFLYLLFYIARRVFMFIVAPTIALGYVDLKFSWIVPLIHGAIWIVSIYSVYRYSVHGKKSVLDDIIKWL